MMHIHYTMVDMRRYVSCKLVNILLNPFLDLHLVNFDSFKVILRGVAFKVNNFLQMLKGKL